MKMIIIFSFLLCSLAHSTGENSFFISDLKSNSLSEDDTRYMSEKVRSIFIEIGFNVIDNENVESIYREHRLQMSGITDANSTINFGKISNATHLIEGHIDKSNQGYRMTMDVISTRTGEKIVSTSEECNCDFQKFTNSFLDIHVSQIVDEIIERLMNDQNLDNNLLLAATDSSLEAVMKYVDAGADLDARDAGGNTPLHRAAGEGKLDIVEYLISKGANINSYTYKNPVSVLQTSVVDNGTFECFKYLLGFDQNVQYKCNHGINVFHFAAGSGKYKVVEYLIENHPELLNVKNDLGLSPICVAASKNQKEIFMLLKEAGAKLDFKDNVYGVLEIAINKSSVDFIEFLFNEFDMKSIFYNQEGSKISLFAWAISSNRLDLIDVFLKNGYNIDDPIYDDKPNTVLWFSIAANKPLSVKELIKRGANVNFVDHKGNSLLITAAIKGDLNVVKILVENGADVNFKNKKGNTALEWAGHKKNIEVYSYLKSLYND